MRAFAIRFLAVSITGLLVSACIFGGNGKDGNASSGDGTDAGNGAQAEGGGGSSVDSGNGGSGDTDAGGNTKDASNDPCPRPVLLSNVPMWKPSVQKLGACSSADRGILGSFLTATSEWAAGESMVSASCQKCVFSNVSDASWGVVVWSPNQAAGTGFLNVGGCFQLLSGSSGSTCGAAAQTATACNDMACPDTCQNRSACRSSAQTGACGSSISAAQSACGTNYSNYASVCSETNLDSLVNVLCGSGGAG